MKRLALFLLPSAFLLCAPLAHAGNNLKAETLRDSATGDKAKLSSTESGGVHTPHVIVDSGAVTPSATGAAHQANSQVSATTTAGTLIVARPTRRSCLIRNTDASITVYIGAATVTTGNGMPLKAGESTVVTAITLLQVIAASGSPVVAVFDEYD